MLLGMKALRYSLQEDVFRSPQQGVAWPKSGYIRATCTEHRDNQIPFMTCGCGLYATTSLKILKSYMDSMYSISLLVVAGGNTEVWSEGFRSQYMNVIGAISGMNRAPGPNHNFIDSWDLTAMKASKYFDVDVIDAWVASEMIRESWKNEGYEVDEEYFGRDSDFSLNTSYKKAALRVQKTR